MKKVNWRAYLEFAKKSFQEQIAYRSDLVIRVIALFFSFYLLTIFWTALYGNAATTEQAVEGIPLSSMITYAILSAVTGGLLNVFGILQVYISYWMSRKMRTGEIISDMLKPTDFQFYLLAHSLGRLVFNLIFSIPIVLVAFLIFELDPPTSREALGLFVLSLSGGYLLLFLIDFLISLSAFWTTQTRGIGGMTRLVVALLSGSFVPLWFFPDWAKGTLTYLPFASIYHTPLSIYIGRIAEADAMQAISVQVVWIVLLFILSRIIWQRSRQKLMIHGG
ncbi:MAG: ABC-2 family transporter protein [Chloroflexota bacterium]